MTKKPVWAHNELHRDSRLNLEYCAGRDVQPLPMADKELIPFDLWTNQAHCYMLLQCGILSKNEAHTILLGLHEIQEKFLQGQFFLQPELEDVHTNIEQYLERVAGKQFSGKLHTARSRNDQVTCDLRLYMRSKGIHLAHEALYFAQELLNKAPSHLEDIMPGITHFQPAIITTFAHLICSYAQPLLRDIHRLVQFLDRSNINPLGAAAAYGTSWNIDRSITTKYLGFKDIQNNSLDCITNRWEFETEFVSILSLFMTHMSIISQDLMLFSSPYLHYCTIHPAYTTGSSIMPQKQNPDFAEVTRAKTSIITGNLQSLFGLSKGMNSGYNRDTQWIKYLLQDSLQEIGPIFKIFSKVFHTLKTHPEKMHQQCRVGFINAIEIADFLAREKGLSFRQAYTTTGKSVQQDQEKGSISLKTLQKVLKEEDLDVSISEKEFKQLTDYRELLEKKSSAGGPAPVEVKNTLESLHKQSEELQQQLGCLEQFTENGYKDLQKDIQRLLKDTSTQ